MVRSVVSDACVLPRNLLSYVVSLVSVWLQRWWSCKQTQQPPMLPVVKLQLKPPLLSDDKVNLPRAPPSTTDVSEMSVKRGGTPTTSNLPVPRTLSMRKPAPIPTPGAIHSHRRCASSNGTASTTTASAFQTPASKQVGTLNAREALAVALRCAVVRREVHSVKSLLENKSEMVTSLLTNWSDPVGHAIIHAAVATTEPAVVEILLNYVPPSDLKAVVNCSGPQGQTALHIACTKRSLSICKILLERGADSNCMTRSLTRPLHLATTVNDIALCELLLTQGADPNCISKFNAIPLITAVRLRNYDMVKLLLKHGANPRLSPAVSCNCSPRHRLQEGENARGLAWQLDEKDMLVLMDEQIKRFNHQRQSSRSSFS